jgi:predicted TIM-barrel fold metal-dependent hydrolase
MGETASIYFPRAETSAMIGTMDECGVKMLVFSHHLALFSPNHGNQPSIDAVRRYPDRLRAYCVINPNYPEIVQKDIEEFDQYLDVFVGFKFLSDYHQVALTDDRYRPAWEYADQHRLLILMHTWGGSSYDGPQCIRPMAERYPNVKILMGHSCHGEWDKAVQLAKDFANVFLELTAIFDDRGVLEKFCNEAGSHKMLFGTDLPWFDPHQAVGALLSARITDEDRHAICHRNAEKLLNVHET